MDSKTRLRKDVWENKDYYLIAKESSLDTNHPGMKILKDYAFNAKRILDLGCGEGTKANQLYSEGKIIVGVDISKTAILLAKKQYPRMQFRNADLEKLPFDNDGFDLVYSTFVLEHLNKPELVLKEAIRVTKQEGYLVLIAPNYGAPNRASPSFVGSRPKKFITGFFYDFLILFGFRQNSLFWNRVNPIISEGNYAMDWDTTVEPYITSLMHFLKGDRMLIKKFTSCWSEEMPRANIHQVIFRFLAWLGIYPFIFWGPHMVIVAQKNEK